MSKIGKQIINIPAGVKIESDNGILTIKGPLGEASLVIPHDFSLEKTDSEIKVYPNKIDKDNRALWGTIVANLKNTISGVSQNFEKRLEVEGVGYRCEVQGKELVLNIGFSHPVKINIPDNLNVRTEKNTIIISGINNQQVGQFASSVRVKRKPNVYKGNGIRYAGEIIKRKSGKKIAGAAG